MVKLGEFCGSSVNLWCQLPIGNLETLISITFDDRLKHNCRRSYLLRRPAVDSQSFLLRPFVRLQVYPHVATRFSDTSAFLRELTLKSMLTLAPKVDEEPAIRTNTTILLGNIASHLNEGGSWLYVPPVLIMTSLRLQLGFYRTSLYLPLILTGSRLMNGS